MADWRGGKLVETCEFWVRSLQLDSYRRLWCGVHQLLRGEASFAMRDV